MRKGLPVVAALGLAVAMSVTVVATARAESGTIVVDFEGLSEGSLVDHVAVGVGASGAPATGSIAVLGERRSQPGVSRAMVFDGACLPAGTRQGCTRGEDDLFFPSLGNLLIVSEEGDVSDPSDAKDGVLTFDFRGFGPGWVRVESLVLADTDKHPRLTLVTATGASSTRELPSAGNRHSLQVTVGAAQVVEMTLDLRGKGAVDRITLSTETTPPTTVPVTTTTTTVPGTTTTTTPTTTTVPATTTTTTTVPGTTTTTLPPTGPALALTVLANGEPAAAAPGPSTEAGAAVAWAYDVTNSGSGNLWSLYLWHTGVGSPNCPDRSLAPGETVRCTASSVAEARAYDQAVEASAWDSAGARADAVARAHYTGTGPVVVSTPSIDLETFVAGSDADTPPGPTVTPGETIRFRYEIRNTGNVEWWGLWVRDDALGTIPCPLRHLHPGDSVVCEVSRVAGSGAHTAAAEAHAWDAAGGEAVDQDRHHYLGAFAAPAVEIEALVEGFDGDIPPGPRVRQPGETILFTYVVTNTGGLPLTGARVVDDALGVATCPGNTLAVGETMTCTNTTVARLGEFVSAGRATASAGAATVSDSDPIYYHVRSEPRIHNLVIEVTVNGFDADDAASGPSIPVGGSARFAYTVTYTGNSTVYSLHILDPRVPESLIACDDDGALRAGETMRCSATVPAAAGPYSSLVTAVSWDADGRRVTAEDPVYYYGMA